MLALEVCDLLSIHRNGKGLIFSVVAVVGCATAGYFGQRLGRKPVLLAVLAISMAAQTSVILSQILEGWLEFLFLFIWVVCQTIASPVSTIFVINLYIVDVSTAEERYHAGGISSTSFLTQCVLKNCGAEQNCGMGDPR